MAEGGEESEPGPNLLMGSDAGCEFPCQPCSREGADIEGTGYCVTCGEYLCGDCYRHHRKSKLSRHHDVMPRETRTTVDVCTNPCQEHAGKVVEYYCPDHDVLGCTVCMTMDHKTCDSLQYIPDVAKTLDLSQKEELLTYQERNESIRVNANRVLENAKINIAVSKRCASNAIQAFRNVREKIVGRLDSAEMLLKQEVDSLLADDTRRLASASETCQTILGNVETMLQEYKVLSNRGQMCKLFIHMKGANKEVKRLNDELVGTEKDVTITEYKFVPRREVLETIDASWLLGTVEKNSRRSSARQVKTLSVKCDGDSRECSITGLAMLSANQVVAVDGTNHQVKLLDIFQNKVTPVFQFDGKPWGIAPLPDYQFAVTLYDKEEIAVLDDSSHTLDCSGKRPLTADSSQWTLSRTIKVNGSCHGVVYANDKLVVSFVKTGRVDIINMEGDVVKSFDKDGEGVLHFRNPFYVSYNAQHDAIFVTDSGDYGGTSSVTSLTCDRTGTSILTCLDKDCIKKTVHSFPTLDGALGVVTDVYGSVYVCCWRSNNIHLLSGDLADHKVLLGKAGDMDKPYTVCINEDMDELFVGMRKNDNILVFKLSFSSC